MEKKKAGPLLYSIFILFSVVPLFYLPYTHRPFYYPKFFLISFSILVLSIYIIVNKIDINIPKGFLPLFLLFIPFLIRWIFTPFPLFSLFFTLFYIFYPLSFLMFYSLDQKIIINKNILVWIWVLVTQVFSLIILLGYFKVPLILSLLKHFGILWSLNTQGRISLFGGNPNYSAEFLTFSFISFVVIFFYEGIGFKFFRSQFVDIFTKLISLLVILFTIFILSSRASFASGIIGLILLSLLIMRKNKLYIGIFLIFVLILISVFTIPSLRSHLPNKLQNITNINRLKNDIRLRLFYWKVAYYMGLENPITGSGPGMYRVELPRISRKLKEKIGLSLVDYLFNKKGYPLLPTNAHNDSLEFWAEGGFPLLFYFLLFIFYIPWTLSGNIPLWDKFLLIIPLFTIFINSFFGFPFHVPIIFPSIIFYLYIISKNNLTFLKKSYTKYIVLTLSFLFFFISVRFILGDIYLQTGIVTKSIPTLETSSLLDPIEPHVWENLYNFSIGNKNLIDKRISYLKSYFKIADSPVFREYLINLLEKKGKYKDALKNAKIGLSLWNGFPHAYYLYYKAGLYYYELKDLDDAIKYTQIAIEKNKKDIPILIESYTNLSVFYREKKDYKKALFAAEKAKELIEKMLKKRPTSKKYKKKYKDFSEYIKQLKKKL